MNLQPLFRGLGIRGQIAAAGAFAGRLGSFALTTDGVGTKTLIADRLGLYRTIGIDCVAMNVNDLICEGALPRAMVNYLAVPEEDPDPKFLEEIGEGLGLGASQADIEIVGGETTVLPDIVKCFDLAGAAWGMILNHQVPHPPEKGHIIIGIPSTGFHSNGFTEARARAQTNQLMELLTPTAIYVKAIKALWAADARVTGLAHITGGGWNNLDRLGIKWEISDPLPIPNIFTDLGLIDPSEYNIGMGFCVICPGDEVRDITRILDGFHPGTQAVGVVTGLATDA